MEDLQNANLLQDLRMSNIDNEMNIILGFVNDNDQEIDGKSVWLAFFFLLGSPALRCTFVCYCSVLLSLFACRRMRMKVLYHSRSGGHTATLTSQISSVQEDVTVLAGDVQDLETSITIQDQRLNNIDNEINILLGLVNDNDQEIDGMAGPIDSVSLLCCK